MGDIIEVLGEIICLVAVLFVGSIMIMLLDRFTDDDDYVKLKYRDFKKYYNIAPDQYDLVAFSYAYRRIPNSVQRIKIRFGVIDAFRVAIFKLYVELNKRKERCTDQKLQLLQLVQSDIDDIRRETDGIIKIHKGGLSHGNQENPQNKIQEGHSAGQKDD